MNTPASVFVVTIGLALMALRSAAAAPDWLLEIDQRTVPVVDKEAPAVVLLDQIVQTVDETGKTTTVHRGALRILTRAGTGRAVASASYIEKVASIRSAEAWLWRGAKTVKAVSSRNWLDQTSLDPNSISTEQRLRFVSLQAEAEPGDLFGFETRVEGALTTAEVAGQFGSDLPVVLQRFELRLPAGFVALPTIVGESRLKFRTSAEGRVQTWDLVERPYRRCEDWAAAGPDDEPLLMVKILPGPKAKQFRPPVFGTWSEVAKWTSQLVDPPCDRDPALAATARRLIESVPDRPGQIRALASYVQKLRYVAIARDLGLGGGVRPRRATEVHAQGWGDCKDKTNLLRALLREIGVTAYPVAVLASDTVAVEPSFPSPMQFNHAITAIVVDDAIDLPTVVTTPKWGRVLFFDPTDESVPFGNLPWVLQSTLGLLEAAGSDDLIRLPVLPEDRQWKLERKVALKLGQGGVVTGEGTLRGIGQDGANLRGRFGKVSEKEMLEWTTGRLNLALRNAVAQTVRRIDEPENDQYSIQFEFSATGIIQPLRESLALVRLDLLHRDTVPVFTEKERRTPVLLRPLAIDDWTTLELPPGLSAAELPPPTKMHGPYGSHEKSFAMEDGKVVFRRSFQLRRRVVPVAEYAALKQFLADAAKADRATVVLKYDECGSETATR